MSNSILKIPAKKYAIHEKLDQQGTLGKQIGWAVEAAGFAMRDGIPNILFDQKTQWYDIFKSDYETQPRNDIQTDIYEISRSEDIVVGSWEGFITSFIWRKIQFKNVFIQLVIGKRYYLPLELITQIQEKVDVRYNVFNPTKVDQKPLYMDWNQEVNLKGISSSVDYMGTIIMNNNS